MLLKICLNFTKHRLTNEVFGSTSNTKPKDIWFTIKENKDKLHMFTFEKLKEVNIWHFCRIKTSQ